jgi:hypothetical protein
MKLRNTLYSVVVGLEIITSLAHAVQHNFAHYKEETLKLLPLLKLDPTTISFIEVAQTPSIEQRQQHQNTIFLNPTKLNAKPLSIALFSCAVEAKLGTLSPDQWEKITEFKKTPPVMPIFLASIPTIFFGMHLFINHVLDKKPVNFVSTTLLSLIGAGWIGSYLLHKHDSKKDREAHVRNIDYEFEYKKCAIQMNLLIELLDSEQSAALAIAGLIPTKIQHKKTIDLIKVHPALFAGLVGINLINRMDQIELLMELWMSKHPDQIKLLEQQFKDECKIFGDHPDLSILEV